MYKDVRVGSFRYKCVNWPSLKAKTPGMKMFAYDEICQGQGRSHSKSLPTFGFASWFPSSGRILKMLEYFFSKQKWLRKVFLDKWVKIYIYVHKLRWKKQSYTCKTTWICNYREPKTPRPTTWSEHVARHLIFSEFVFWGLLVVEQEQHPNERKRDPKGVAARWAPCSHQLGP